MPTPTTHIDPPRPDPTLHVALDLGNHKLVPGRRSSGSSTGPRADVPGSRTRPASG
jgi:hypothetical protein